jgi:hypothetical protein
MSPTSNLTEVSVKMDSLISRIEGRDKLDEERRKTDDARYTTLSKRHEEILERVDKHGIRTTALETKWAAFFGDEGAFKLVMKGLENLDKKSDKQNWFIAIGIGILGALQFLLPIWRGK